MVPNLRAIPQASTKLASKLATNTVGGQIARKSSISPDLNLISPKYYQVKKIIFTSTFLSYFALTFLGEEKRTTLMVKNIPNKYTQEMLLDTISERHKGLYDFFYLPIDFKVYFLFCLCLFISSYILE